jgi:phosphoribosyl-AMP cyclohydrolase
MREGGLLTMDLSKVKFNEQGLVPAIAQDAATGEVLMMAWMNAESLRLTEETGYATYFSRSRQQLWKKGETSGHVQRVLGIKADCDGDTLLLTVEQTGPACHTGARSCFFNDLIPADEDELPAGEASLDTGNDAGLGLSNAPAADYSLDEVDLDEPEPFFSTWLNCSYSPWISVRKCSVPFGRLRIDWRLMISVEAAAFVGNCSDRLSRSFFSRSLLSAMFMYYLRSLSASCCVPSPWRYTAPHPHGSAHS